MAENEVVGYLFRGDETPEEIRKIAKSGSGNKTIASFVIADSCKMMQATYGEKHELLQELADDLDMSINSVSMYASWGNIYPHKVRTDKLSFNKYREAARITLDGKVDKSAAIRLIEWASEQEGLKHGEFIQKRDGIKDALPCSDEVIDTILASYGPTPPPKPVILAKFDFTHKYSLSEANDVEGAIASLTASVLQEWKNLIESGKTVEHVRLKLHSEFMGEVENG